MEIKKNMKATLLSIGVLAALLLAGCSQEAKSDMSQPLAMPNASHRDLDAGPRVRSGAATDTKKAARGGFRRSGYRRRPKRPKDVAAERRETLR